MKKQLKMTLSAVVAAGLLAGCTPKPAPTVPVPEPQGQTDYVYGTARLSWAQFWSNEGLTYERSLSFDAVNEQTDTEGVQDLGGYDAVTRATQKHGVYRGSVHYANLLHAEDLEGNAIQVYLDELTDGQDVADHFGAGSVFYGLADGSYRLAQPEEESTVFTVTQVEVTGYRQWPVRVPAHQVEDAAQAVDFVQDSSITADTGLLKTVTVEDDQVTVYAAAPAAGDPVAYNGEITVSYDDKYGDYIFVQFSECPEDWGRNLLGATYTYYGDADPREDAAAVPIAAYGTKYAADTWWKSGGKLLQFGINTSHRHGGQEKYGYWQITVMSHGYEDYTATILALPPYPNQLSARLDNNNTTLIIDGISNRDWDNTSVSLDGAAVENMEKGSAVVTDQAIGTHTVTVNIDGYRAYDLEAIAMSDLTAADITLENNVLQVRGDFQNYIANITGIAVGDTTLSGTDLGDIVFGTDGAIDFDARMPGKREEIVVFPNGSSESYVLIVSAAGYPNVVLTTQIVP